MERRTVFAFFITFLFLIGYYYLISKFVKKPQEVVQEVIEEKEKTKIIEKEEDLQRADLDTFSITFSPRGGYINELFIKKYNQDLIFKNIGYIDEDKDKIFDFEIKENRIIFKDKNGYKKEYIFDGYKLIIDFNYPTKKLLVFSNPLHSNILEQNYQFIFSSINKNINHISLKKVKNITKNVEFTGAMDKYFCISLLSSSYSIRYEKKVNGIDFILASPPSKIELYIGPQIEKELKKFGLEDIINYGFLGEITFLIRKMLYFLYYLTKNWGLSIIFLTIIIYIILFPFTLSSTKTAKKLASIQPLLNELKEKYKDNLAKFQKEQIELFKQHRINPLGGCLPLLLQIPIFFALFQVFSRFIEFKGVNFLWIDDLTLPDRAFKLPFNLPYFGNYINILPILMLFLNIFQQKFNPQSYSSKEQKFSSFFLLGFIGILFYHFPSSLLIYWLIQSLLTFLFQLQQFKSLGLKSY